jgi:hypothetical protein
MKFEEWLEQVQIQDVEISTTWWPTDYVGVVVTQESDFDPNALERFSECEPNEQMYSSETYYLCGLCDELVNIDDFFIHWEGFHKDT